MAEFIDVDPGELYLPPAEDRELIRASSPGKSASMAVRSTGMPHWNLSVER